jgi:spore coat polysaccharide biosynthesis protein SpsF
VTDLVVIQARMASTRLPGKVMLPLEGRPLISWVLRAARATDLPCEIVVATSTEVEDDQIVELCAAEGASVVRGSRDDVLSRFITVLDANPAETVIRLTADCPFLDPGIIRMAASAFSSGNVDYLATAFPRTLPRGFDVEVVAASALRRAADEARGYHRAHVTSYLYDGAADFRCAGLTFQPDASDLRVTVDTVEDLRVAELIARDIGDRPPSWVEVVRFLRANPEVVEINRGVVQKQLEEG